jgi:hypothetical protein
MLISHRNLSVLLLAATCVSAQAATYYVSTTGSDSASGTLSTPWRTLRKGLTSLRAGDTLLIRGGTYEEVLGGGSSIKIYPGTSSAGITVRNYGSERPVLKGLLWLSRPSYWTIDGLNVTWKDGQPSTYHMVKVTNGVNWKFMNAEVWGAKSYADMLVCSTLTSEPSNWQISGCAIHDTYKSNNTNQDHLIYVNTGLSAGSGLIERNLLFNALNGNGVKLGGADNTQGTTNVTVRYNTIYNTSQNVLIAWKSANNNVYRNILGKTDSNYGCVRGYQLTGGNNFVYDNLGYSAKSMILNDPGYLGVKDGGNTFPVDPLFDAIGLTGFHPLNSSAVAFGRYATTIQP